MDYRDNRQRWAESHQVVHFYAGQWCTFTPASAPSRNRLRDKRPLGGSRGGSRTDALVAGATIAAPIHSVPRAHGSAIARCWSAAMSTRWSSRPGRRQVIGRHPRSYEQEDFVFDPLRYLSLLESKDQRAGSGGSLGPAGCCRRCSAISAAYLKRGWAKPGSGNTSRCCG